MLGAWLTRMQNESQRAILDMTMFNLPNLFAMHRPPMLILGAEDDVLVVNGAEIKVVSAKTPAELPWKALGVDYVIESTGLFTDSEKAKGHLAAGAKKVLITAPAKGDCPTIVMGVNQDKYDAKQHHIISNASCTTNCLAPLVKAIDDRIGVVSGLRSHGGVSPHVGGAARTIIKLAQQLLEPGCTPGILLQDGQDGKVHHPFSEPEVLGPGPVSVVTVPGEGLPALGTAVAVRFPWIESE